MKRILSIMLVLTISWTTFFIVGSEAFASGQLVETKPTPSSTVVNPSKSSDSLSKQADTLIVGGLDGLKMTSQAALEYYFNVLLTDHYGVSVDGYPQVRFDEDYYYTYSDYVTSDAKPIRAVSSDGLKLNCFNPDYLYDYFVVLCTDDDKCDYDSASFWSSYILEHGNSLSALMNNLHKTGLSPSMALSVLTPKSGSYDFETFSNYYNSLYAKYLSQQNQLSISVGYENTNPETYVQPIRIPSDSFVNAINNNTTSLTTSIPTSSISWKNNPLSVSGYDKGRLDKHLLMMGAGKWFGAGKDLYAMPFVVKDGVTYYSDSVYHMYYGDFTYSVKSGSDYIEYSLSDYPMIDKYSSFSSSGDIVDSLYIMPAANSTTGYTKLSWSEVYSFPGFLSEGFKSLYTGDVQYYMSGLSSVTSLTNLNFFYKNENNLLTNLTGSRIKLFDNFYNASNVGESTSFAALRSVPATETTARTDILTCMEACASNPYASKTSDGKYALSVNDVPYDYGFLICSKRFEIGTLMSYLDGRRIPSDSYITINNGDSVYDYSITNSTTGDTTNLGDFINHGYAWINTGSGTQNNQGSGSGNGGGNGGNVTVGGDVNVSGSVDVNVSGGLDINVNVNGGGSGNGGGNKGGNGNTSLNESDTNILNDNLDDATEKSIGIRKFLEEFFSFLPPELLSLLAILFTVVIIKVIFNRK